MYKHILIPTDGSTLSAKAVKTGLRLAKCLGARVSAIHIIPPYTPPYDTSMMIYVTESGFDSKSYKRATEQHAREMLDEIKNQARTAGVNCETAFMTNPQPWKAILNYARTTKCNAIVMASHGRRGIAGLLLGSETTKVLTHSKFPVLVCR